MLISRPCYVIRCQIPVTHIFLLALQKCKPAIPICRATSIRFHHCPFMHYPSPERLPWLLRTLLASAAGRCAQCGAHIVAPEWSEHLSETRVRNVWSCEACGYRFEDTIYLSERQLADSD